MSKVAIFVDAGYVFAQGSVALAGQKVARIDLSLSAESAKAALLDVAARQASHCRLLRIYWYDGSQPGMAMTADQAVIADLDDVKLRLGFINSQGQQKGVDSLIVTDLIELARLQAISDAVLVSGDEDIRVGVQIAQNYGVRVHLVGIEPVRGSQARTLRQEADTNTFGSKAIIENFLSVRQLDVTVGLQPEVADNREMASWSDIEPEKLLEEAVREIVAHLTTADIESLGVYWKTERGVPSEFDKKLLGKAREKIGRNCERDEMQYLRKQFRLLLQAMTVG